MGQNHTLTSLSLSGIPWNNEYVDVLSQSMRLNSSIEIFRLEGTLTPFQQRQLVAAVHTHPVVQELKFVDRDSAVLIDLARILKGNRTLSHIKLGAVALFPDPYPVSTTGSSINRFFVRFATMVMETTDVSVVRAIDSHRSERPT